LKKIKELNEDDNIDGFIVQLPLPVQIDEQKVLMAVVQVKMLMDFILRILENGLRHEYIYSSDAFWYFELLERYGVETQNTP
jgi:methylenetetrahydrofolate dehydrogenase (NADP+)/methenyltetrahydrofolate cyclohydrolase